MSVKKQYFPGTVQRDLFNVLCGDRLGKGTAREVYECTLDPTKVIKIEYANASFQNVMEWDIWLWASHGPLKKWFAPCRFISGCGIVMVQDRVQPLPKTYKLPKKLPSLIGDLKRENFGLLKGRLVTCDYGTAQTTLQNMRVTTLAAQRFRVCDWSPGSQM